MTPREIAEALRAAKSLNADDLEPLRVYTEAKRATGAPLAVEEAVLSAAHECREAFRVLVRATESERGSREYALDVFKAQGIASRLQGFVLAQQHDQTVAVLYEVHRVRREAFLMLVDVFASVADRIVATPEEQAAETARANAETQPTTQTPAKSRGRK